MWYYSYVSIQNLLQFLSSFSIIASAGVILGLLLVAWRAPERKIFYTDAGVGVTLGALVGARAGFVLRNWEYFQAHAPEIPQIWLGGLTWPGAFLGGILALAAISLATKHHLGELDDALLPLLGALAASIWLACWAEGCAYGPPAEGWWGVPVRGEFGEVARRWPLQALGAILSGILVFGVDFRARRWPLTPGRSAILGVGGISLINLIISLFRVDPAPYLWGLRQESWFAILITILAAGAFFALREKDAKDAEEIEGTEEPMAHEPPPSEASETRI